MAPSYRTATQTRRGNRGGYPEHDDFEGLPVRQWRHDWVNIAPPKPQKPVQKNDRWSIDLPYGMPKDYHLLPPHSQELLRATRSGRLYKRAPPPEEEEPEVEGAERVEKKEDPVTVGFMAKLWKQVPRNVEVPTTSHLAKRHKNTVTRQPKAAPISAEITGPTVTRATVRRMDAAGNPYEQTITLAEGQEVDGQIISTSVVPAPAITSGDAAAQQSTPARRRPPPPKRRAKGPGRGRKKARQPLPPPLTTRSAQPSLPFVDGPGDVKPQLADANGAEGEAVINHDSEMADGPEGDEGEGDEGDEDSAAGGVASGAGNDENSNNIQGGDETLNMGTNTENDRNMEDSSDAQEVIRPSSIEEPEPEPAEEMVTEEHVVTNPHIHHMNPFHLVPPHALLHLTSPRHEGSPLKNEILQSPIGPSPTLSPVEPESRSGRETRPQNGVDSVGDMCFASSLQSVNDSSSELSTPNLSIGNGVEGDVSTDAADNDPVEGVETTVRLGARESRKESRMTPSSGHSVNSPTGTGRLPSLRQASTVPTPPAAAPGSEADNDMLDLIGGLERELDRQAGVSSGAATPGAPTTTGNSTPNGTSPTPG